MTRISNKEVEKEGTEHIHPDYPCAGFEYLPDKVQRMMKNQPGCPRPDNRPKPADPEPEDDDEDEDFEQGSGSESEEEEEPTGKKGSKPRKKRKTGKQDPIRMTR